MPVSVEPEPGTAVASGRQRRRSRLRQDGGFYRSGEVCQIVGLTRRQLSYWARTGLVRPSVRTQGGHYRYGFRDLVALKAAKRLIDAGVSVQRIRKSMLALSRTLPHVRRPLSDLVLVATGDLVLVLRDDAAFEAVSGQQWILDLAAFRAEVEAWRREAVARKRPAARAVEGPSARSA